ncbi:MAG: trigger factor [Puniceicoccales bacterium]|nr:trigger factor [Puniceicoccales bacterium]
MKEEIINISDTRLNVVYAFDSDEVAAENESVVEEFCREADIPGFRKGKAPKGIIQSKFSSAIGKQLKSSITKKVFSALEKQTERWTIASIVDVKHEDTPNGMVCTVTIDIIPSFELPDYESISIDPIDVVVGEDEVRNAAKSALKQYAKYEIVEREAKTGDYVKLNYLGKFSGGGSVAEIKSIPTIYGTQTNTWEEAGNTSAPGVHAIVEGIIGTKAGDRKTVLQKFEDDFKISELRGESITYDIEIIEVRECILPELTDDFLKVIGVQSESELHEKTKALILSHKTSQAKIKQREELVAKLIAGTSIKIPQSSIDEKNISLLNEFVTQQAKHGINSDEIEKYSQSILDSLRPTAETRVKLAVILDKIAEKENIKISHEDFENMVLHDIRAQKLDANKYIGELRRDSSKLSDLRKRILRGKTLDHLQSLVCKDPEINAANVPQ